MKCVVSDREDSEIGLETSVLRGIVGQTVFQEFGLGFHRGVMMVSVENATALGYTEAVEASKLISQIAGSVEQGGGHALKEKHGIIIIQIPRRSLQVDLAAERLGHLRQRVVVVERETEGPDHCAVFITARPEIAERVLERAKELGIKHSSYGWPIEEKQSDTVDTEAKV